MRDVSENGDGMRDDKIKILRQAEILSKLNR